MVVPQHVWQDARRKHTRKACCCFGMRKQVFHHSTSHSILPRKTDSSVLTKQHFCCRAAVADTATRQYHCNTPEAVPNSSTPSCSPGKGSRPRSARRSSSAEDLRSASARSSFAAAYSSSHARIACGISLSFVDVLVETRYHKMSPAPPPVLLSSGIPVLPGPECLEFGVIEVADRSGN